MGECRDLVHVLARLGLITYWIMLPDGTAHRAIDILEWAAWRAVNGWCDWAIGRDEVGGVPAHTSFIG